MTFAQPFQDYEILDRVGAGAMGTVFKARQKRLNRIVALKVLKPSLARDSRYVDRLRREARIVASLNHPYIVSGYDLGEEGGYHYFVMEFVEGKSLRGLLLEWGMFAEEYVRRVARQTAMALDHAYQRGVIHRDIKPGNILIDEAGNVKLTDMGLAKGPADLTLTRDGATVGTPQYISPEQARNPHDVDVRSDLYSLGATLYHMAAGVPPYRGDTMAELITNVLGAVPTPPNEINPALSDGLSLIIRKLLVKDLSVRYQTPQELLDDLDRIDRSQPPKVDAARLAAEAAESSSWLGRSLLAVAVALLLGVAWWVGVESRTPAVPGQSKEQFLIGLDSELAALPTPGARLRRLDAISTSPTGTEAELAQRRRTVTTALDAAVNRIVEQMLGNGWSQLVGWLRDPLEWPDLARFDREKLVVSLRDQAGISLEQVAATERVQELERAVARTLTERDAELVTRFDLFLVTALPTRVDDRLRSNDFRGANRLWEQGLALFFESVRLQPLERLPEAVRLKLQEKHALARQQAASELDTAEKNAAEKLLVESDAVVRLFREHLRDGEDPDTVRQTIRDYRQELETLWPAAEKFRAEHNPWPEVERRLGTLHAEVAMAAARLAEQRLQRRFDFAWRTLCHGRARDALAVLADVGDLTEVQAGRLQRHRHAFEAAAAVEASVLAAVGRANTPPVAFPCVGSGVTFELRVEPQGGEPSLVAQAIGQPPRRARLTEFRFSYLLKQLLEAGLNPLEGVPAPLLTLGQCVLRLVGDDLTGIAEPMQGLDQDERLFLVDEVTPRVLRVREQRLEPSFDREALLARLIEARKAAQAGSGTLVALEGEIAAFQRATENDRTSHENVELRAAQTWWTLAHKREAVLAEIDRSAPRGAEVDVRIVDNHIDAEVAMGASVLQHEATDGWQRVEGALQYAGAGRPWSESPSCMLQANPGFESTALHPRLKLDFVLPPPTVGARFYLIEFRGIVCALLVAANGGVHATLVEGDARREENVQRAFQRALAGVLNGAPEALAIPGAVHRLIIDVHLTTLRTRAQVHVAFEGVELWAGTSPDLSPLQGPTCIIHPLQEIAVQRIAVQALDL